MAKEIKELKKEESELKSTLIQNNEIIKDFQPQKVQDKLDAKDQKISMLNETVAEYKKEMQAERRE